MYACLYVQKNKNKIIDIHCIFCPYYESQWEPKLFSYPSKYLFKYAMFFWSRF